mmetsp:Transcript_19871/g.24568  ORF Transcript_19871/g.24568 Transcript_19871/m.24568 type:complete len:477 (+) Transcript_19871:2061-3491(+)
MAASPPKPTGKASQLVEENKESGDNTANPEGQNANDSPRMKGSMFGATMQGFKLDNEDSSDEDMDKIAPELRAYYPQRIDKKRKKIKTWQDNGLSWSKAFFTGAMRSNDIRIYWSFIFMGGLLIIYGSLATAYSWRGFGIMMAFTLLHVILLIISMLGYIVANRQMSPPERVLQVIAFMVIYISGIAYFFIAYDFSLLSKEDSELNADELYEKNAAILYVGEGMIVVPLITSLLAFVARAYRDTMNGRRMTIGFKVLLALNSFHILCFVIFTFIYLERRLAIIILILLIFAIFGLTQYVLRFRYKDKVLKVSEKISFPPHKLNKCFNITNILLGIAVFVAAFIWVRYSPNQYSDFASYTFIIWVMIGILFFASVARIIGDRTRMDEMPIYHSPWVFPIYKYYPELNDVVPYTSGVIIFYLLAAIAAIWSIWATVEISPSWLGVGITCALEALMIFFTLYVTNTNNVQYKAISSYVD